MNAVRELGISVPTEIQGLGIPSVLEGKSVILGSHTGSGKTLAYMLPIVQLEGTGQAVYLNLLRLFVYGTWSDYKSHAGSLLQLVPEQILKLKQLTVLSMSETGKVLPYDQLMQELDVANDRQLEDFLIECMYAGIVRGKLDQFRRCFEVETDDHLSLGTSIKIFPLIHHTKSRSHGMGGGSEKERE